MVAIDATILMLAIHPDAGTPRDAAGRPITRAADRVDYLIETLDQAQSRILIPTPALSEVLVRLGRGAAQVIIDELNKASVFELAPFDTRAAIEVAALTREQLARGRKKLNPDAVWAKLKYDWQIVAIAKVNNATTLYSDDRDLRAAATRAGLDVQGLADLALPPAKDQRELELEEPGQA